MKKVVNFSKLKDGEEILVKPFFKNNWFKATVGSAGGHFKEKYAELSNGEEYVASQIEEMQRMKGENWFSNILNRVKQWMG